MMKNPRVALVLVLLAGLTGCSGNYSGFGLPNFGYYGRSNQAAAERGLVGTSVDRQGNERNVNITMTGGGEVGLRSMDGDDKRKMFRALDAGTGKSTHWENGATGISYTVTPTRKITIRGNPFCREYTVEAQRGGSTRTTSGTACITTDGAWHSM